MKWYELAGALTTAGVTTAPINRIILPAVDGDLGTMAFPPNVPNIWFICLVTMTGVPIEMRLDDRMKDFHISVCNFSVTSGKPFIAAGQKGKKLRILFRSDVPLKHHQIQNVSYDSPPTLRKFFEDFNIKPDKSVIVEFASGFWHEDKAWYNDFFWWQVNVLDT